MSAQTFFMPFSIELWACIVLMVFGSGIVDWLLERGSGGSILSSLHEYFGGVLWGGFQAPHTRLSAIYQVITAFLILLAVSAFTANLAAYMTLRTTPPSRSFSSVADLIQTRTAACAVENYALQTTLEAINPGLNFLPQVCTKSSHVPSPPPSATEPSSRACRSSVT